MIKTEITKKQWVRDRKYPEVYLVRPSEEIPEWPESNDKGTAKSQEKELAYRNNGGERHLRRRPDARSGGARQERQSASVGRVKRGAPGLTRPLPKRIVLTVHIT